MPTRREPELSAWRRNNLEAPPPRRCNSFSPRSMIQRSSPGLRRALAVGSDASAIGSALPSRNSVPQQNMNGPSSNRQTITDAKVVTLPPKRSTELKGLADCGTAELAQHASKGDGSARSKGSARQHAVSVVTGSAQNADENHKGGGGIRASSSSTSSSSSSMSRCSPLCPRGQL